LEYLKNLQLSLSPRASEQSHQKIRYRHEHCRDDDYEENQVLEFNLVFECLDKNFIADGNAARLSGGPSEVNEAWSYYFDDVGNEFDAEGQKHDDEHRNESQKASETRDRLGSNAIDVSEGEVEAKSVEVEGEAPVVRLGIVGTKWSGLGLRSRRNGLVSFVVVFH
jgi:hypothetical protein